MSQRTQRWATFDCYGTLVDWEGGMRQAVATIAPDRAAEVMALYYEIEPEVEHEVFRPYREVLAETLRRTAAKIGLELSPGSEHVLSNTLPDWPIFEDVGPALKALHEQGWKLAILSNVDRDLIAKTLQKFPEPIDLIVTAEDVKSYKPALGHFQRFRELTGVTEADWVHVARSFFHDIRTASQLGLRSVWINRGNDPTPEPLATVILPNLQALPATLAQL